jgi:hypothetical protein
VQAQLRLSGELPWQPYTLALDGDALLVVTRSGKVPTSTPTHTPWGSKKRERTDRLGVSGGGVRG